MLQRCRGKAFQSQGRARVQIEMRSIWGYFGDKKRTRCLEHVEYRENGWRQKGQYGPNHAGFYRPGLGVGI